MKLEITDNELALLKVQRDDDFDVGWVTEPITNEFFKSMCNGTDNLFESSKATKLLLEKGNLEAPEALKVLQDDHVLLRS